MHHDVAATSTIHPLALQEIPISDKGRRKQIMQELSALYDADCVSLVGFHGAFYTEVSFAKCCLPPFGHAIGKLEAACALKKLRTFSGTHHHLSGVHGWWESR